MGGLHLGRLGVAMAAVLSLAACEEGQGLNLGQPAAESAAAAGEPIPSGEFRDVESPEVFSANETGLWDGRPSLGGVWVAHPDVTDPERVLIRNTTNGKSVVGALFRRERDNPGPRIQVSSDAASALAMLAGQPTELSVVAMRREEIMITPPPPPPAAVDAEPLEAETIDAAPIAAAPIEAAPIDPIAAAAAAIDEAEAEAEPESAAADIPEPEAAKPAPVSRLAKPYIQIGIFSVEQNATNTAASLRTAGILPSVVTGESQGKAFWRVIVGPAPTASERAAVLRKIKDLGFDDAYFVTN